MTDTTPTRVKRPRTTADREQEFLDAALEVLRDVGYEAFTMDAVAALAKCSKATLYRLWSNKTEIVTAALRAARPALPLQIDTGSLRGDLVAFADAIADRIEMDTPLFAGISHAVLKDPKLKHAITTQVSVQEENITAFVGRAVARGELSGVPGAAEFMNQMFFTMLFARPLFSGMFTDEDYMIRFIDNALLPALRNS